MLGYKKVYLLKSLDNSDKTNKTIKIQKIIIAISVAPSAMPPNPKIAAMIAITRKIIIQRTIVDCLYVLVIPLRYYGRQSKS